MTDTDPVESGPDRADHRLVVDADGTTESVEYHLIASGRIEAADGGAVHNAGAFGHADGSAKDGRAAYRYRGRLLSIKLRPSPVELGLDDHRDAPFEVRVDGTPIDFERWDPSRGDLPLGYGGPGALPDDLAVGVADCDRVVSTREALLAASEELDDGAVLGIDADVHLPEGPDAPLSFPQDDLALVGIETDDGAHPTLSRERTPKGPGHVGLRLEGDRAAVLNLRFRGPLDRYVPYEEYHGRLRGLGLAGEDQVALNCHGWYWPHAAFSARGAGETFLCVDAHHNLLGGLGYGFSTGGPIPSRDWEAGETWSEEELRTYRPWHRRTQIQRVVVDANRHDVAAGRNGSYELRRFVVGPTAVTGTRIDVHRPGGGIVALGEGIVREPTRGLTDGGVHGFWVRGRPVVGARVERVWFGWGEEPDPGHRYPGADAPIVQVCTPDDVRDRRRVWDTSDGPFVRVEWADCAFGPDEPSWLPDDLRTAWSAPRGTWEGSDPGGTG